MLCTRQKSVQCPSTFVRPRSVKRSSRLLCRKFANTGSTVANRRPYCARPLVESMRAFMRMVCVSRGVMPSRSIRPRENARLRTSVVSGVPKQRARNVHGTPSRFAPRKYAPMSSFVMFARPLRLSEFPAGHVHVRAAASYTKSSGVKCGDDAVAGFDVSCSGFGSTQWRACVANRSSRRRRSLSAISAGTRNAASCSKFASL